MNAKYQNKITFLKKLIVKLLLGLIIIGVISLGYTFLELKQFLYKVYETKPEYMLTTPNTNLVIVEFSDYTCEGCRQLHPNLRQAIQKDGKVSYIPRPLAYNDPWKTKLASSVYAAANQGKMIEMHDAIYAQWPIADENKLFDVAKSIGLDTQKLSRDMRSDAVKEAVTDNERLFDLWKFSRVPTILIGDSSIYIYDGSALSVNEFLEKIQEAR